MKYQIRWTEKSADTFEEIVTFLRERWSEKAVERFVKDSFSTFDFVTNFPLMFKSIKGKNVRKGLINKYVSFRIMCYI